MPEAAPWKFRKIIKPLFDLQKDNILFKCRVIETKSLKVIENGFVEIDNGKIENTKAPEIAINYWNLPLNSKLKDVVQVIRDDEAGHRDVNHNFADILNEKKLKKI